MQVIRFSDLIAQGKVAGKRVFIRADLNVPQDDAGHITEDTRIKATIPGIKHALTAGAAVMVTSHLGRRLLAYLQEAREETLVYPDNTILVSEELSPAMLGEVPEGKLVGRVPDLQLGQAVRVKLTDTNVDRGFIDFTLTR